jgi:uncharacterized SAM-binding protein YcdF (DUF218 family)
VVGVLLLLFAAATARLLVFPPRDAPSRADAIVVLGGHGHRVAAGLRLAREGWAPILLVSTPGQGCPKPIAGVQVICFQPNPYTTQGEARFSAATAQRLGWRHIIVVSSTEQSVRTRLRFGRCTDIDVSYTTSGTALVRWPYVIAYEWAALVKALTLQRSC